MEKKNSSFFPDRKHLGEETSGQRQGHFDKQECLFQLLKEGVKVRKQIEKNITRDVAAKRAMQTGIRSFIYLASFSHVTT
jgi:hypothetical protein